MGLEESLVSLIKIKPLVAIVPNRVTMRQARLALLQVGMLPTVQEAINSSTQEDKITWEFSTEVARDFPVVQNFKITLGLSEEQLDSLFTLASTL